MALHASRFVFALLPLLLLPACGARTTLADVDSSSAGGETSGGNPPGERCIEAGTWHDARPTIEPRILPVLAALPDGRAVAIGGQVAGAPAASIEIYLPSEDAWAFAEPLAEPRVLHTATTLDDGRVLITGGYNGAPDGSGAGITRAEIFDPKTSTVTQTAPMPEGRFAHAATKLPDGRVLVAGGFSPDGGVPDVAAIFDPATATWTEIAAPPDVAGNYVAAVPDPLGARVAAASGVYRFDAEALTWEFEVAPVDPDVGILNVPRATRVGDAMVVVDGYGWLGAGAGAFDWTRLWTLVPDQPAPFPTAILPLCDSVFVIADRAYHVRLDDLSVQETVDFGTIQVAGVQLADGALLLVGGVPTELGAPPLISHIYR